MGETTQWKRALWGVAPQAVESALVDQAAAFRRELADLERQLEREIALEQRLLAEAQSLRRRQGADGPDGPDGPDRQFHPGPDPTPDQLKQETARLMAAVDRERRRLHDLLDALRQAVARDGAAASRQKPS